MADDAGRLDDLAQAIADGSPIDWESLLPPDGSPDRQALPHYRAVAAVADVYRRLAPDPEPPPERGPERWGRLELLERVGSGAYGDVYRAWDPRLEREVALKLLRCPGVAGDAADPASAGSTAATGSQAVEEGRLLARVRHPNVVTVHGADVVDGGVGLWMEFVHGRTLAQAVADEGPLDPDAAMRIGIDVCRALSAVHAAGLIHRDLKAQNVMRDEGGRTVLMDFGTVHDAAPEAAAAGSGLRGTPLYLAPEIFAGAPGTVASDVYATGVLLYHLVTNAYPVTAASIEALRRAHDRGERRRLRDARRDLPPAFARVVEKALARDPARRFATASDMGDALDRARRSSRSPLPGRVLAALAVIGACLVAALLVVMAWRPSLVSPGRTARVARPASEAPTPQRRQVPDRHVFIATGPVTPDGRLLPGLDNGSRALAVMDVASGEVRRLTPAPSRGGDGMNGTAIFSPRFDRIAFVWRAGDADEVRVARADGGGVRTLYRHGGSFTHLAGWTPDAAAIVLVRPAEGTTSAVERLEVETGARTRLLELPHRPPTAAGISADGRRLVYDGPPRAEAAARDIFVADLQTGIADAVVIGPANDTFPFWLPDGRGFLFASNRSGANGLWLQEVSDGRAAGAPRLIEPHIGRVKPPVSVSAAGAFYYRQQTGLVDVFTAPLDLAANRAGPGAAVQTRQVGGHLFPDWSADGRTLAFTWRREDVDFDYHSASLVLQPAGGAERELVPDLDRIALPRLSPDGRQVLVQGARNEAFGLYLVDPASGATRLLARGARGPVEWSPDGRSVFFLDGPSIRELDPATGRRREAYRSAAGIAPPLVISRSGRLGFIEAADARWQRVLLRVLEPGAAPRTALHLAAADSTVILAGWTPDEREILAVRWKEGERDRALVRLPLDGGPPRAMGFAAEGMRDARVSADGDRLAYTAGWPTITQWVLEHVLR